MATRPVPGAGGPRPLYASAAWAYDLVVPDPAGGPIAAIAQRLLTLGVQRGASIVDAGCGSGRYAHALAAAGFRVTGIDRSQALLDQARDRSPAACLLHADMLSWQPARRVDAVLCRGVLNELIADADRAAAFAAFASWLGADGLLLADVRDWEATSARYARPSRFERMVERPGSWLRFSSETELDAHHRSMHIRERYSGSHRGARFDDTYEFAMRCWTPGELRSCASAAGLTELDISPGSAAGLAEDRLSVVARR